MARKKKEETANEELKEEAKKEEKKEEKAEEKKEEHSEERAPRRRAVKETEAPSKDRASAGKEKVEKEVREDISKEVQERHSDMLIPLNDYVRSGAYIGTKVITPHMKEFIYRRRNDGIAIIDTNKIDEKLKEAVRFLGDYNPENVIIVCKREAGWRAVKLFSELTGIRVFTKKYPAGIITNTNLPNFFETELIVVCDPWIDKNALNDAVKMKKKVLGLCDTNNYTQGIDRIVPCNNKSNKSLGVIFYILAREYMKIHGIDKKLPKMEDFIGEELGDFIKDKREEKIEKEKKETLEKDKSKIEELMSVDEHAESDDESGNRKI